MTNCCNQIEIYQENTCPVNGKKGKKVSLTTLKSLLKPMALTKINPEENYYFCDSEDCQVVYFSQEKQVYNLDEIKIAVWQKNNAENIPLCYCFDWTKTKIKDTLINHKVSPVEEIKQHIQAKRCGCEFNNPEGKCCLKNVNQYIKNVLEHTS